MDFMPGTIKHYPGNVVIPHFMTYEDYLGEGKEQDIISDLEYLQQTYPVSVRKYQGRIREIMDKLDYEGSMIYDEYPDKYSLQNLAKAVTDALKRMGNDQKECAKKNYETKSETESDEESAETESEEAENEKWKMTESLIQILICDEIYKRRHIRKRNSYNRFF